MKGILLQLVLVLAMTVMMPTQAFAHISGMAGESLILSKYIRGNIALTADPESQQWKQSSEKNINSLWGHEISVRTLNNGTKIFFLLSWPAKEKLAGAAIMFETPNDVWIWNAGATNENNEGVITKAQWNNGYWNVIFGREIQPKSQSNVSFNTGTKETGWIKFVAWDGSKGESFAKINDEMLIHSDFVLLPEIDIHPKDVFVWSGILAAGGVLFIIVELRIYKK